MKFTTFTTLIFVALTALAQDPSGTGVGDVNNPSSSIESGPSTPLPTDPTDSGIDPGAGAGDTSIASASNVDNNPNGTALVPADGGAPTPGSSTNAASITFAATSIRAPAISITPAAATTPPHATSSLHTATSPVTTASKTIAKQISFAHPTTKSKMDQAVFGIFVGALAAIVV
ncbi:hypothetical protein CPB84DRAFT_1035681 [Gymnopilus junonius]|uniref:Uncharacterized protein n=1 Tax=Gymnopilus junonius TaxID=109634 RepID=A0A9P5NQH5_GYMJU|nr:hypothetical protein CPB84DRAFT_1035681 [Gymnopilus junonius]